MKTATIDYLKANLNEMERWIEEGHEIIMVKDGCAVARLVPWKGEPHAEPGSQGEISDPPSAKEFQSTEGEKRGGWPDVMARLNATFGARWQSAEDAAKVLAVARGELPIDALTR